MLYRTLLNYLSKDFPRHDNPDNAESLEDTTMLDDLNESLPSQGFTTSAMDLESASNHEAPHNEHDCSYPEPPTSFSSAYATEPYFGAHGHHSAYQAPKDHSPRYGSPYQLTPPVSSFEYDAIQPVRSDPDILPLGSSGLQTDNMTTHPALAPDHSLTAPSLPDTAAAGETSKTPTHRLKRSLRQAKANVAAQLSERSRQIQERIAATSGVVIPSKLPPGREPEPIESQALDQTYLPHRCPICNARFGRPDHVKSHFPACVNSYGNPNGANWDDGVSRTREVRRRNAGLPIDEREYAVGRRELAVEAREEAVREREKAVTARERAVYGRQDDEGEM
ncbi:MAG: hypothetical protein Q9191_007137 [Dirinaria sp. TL-2023a]